MANITCHGQLFTLPLGREPQNTICNRKIVKNIHYCIREGKSFCPIPSDNSLKNLQLWTNVLGTVIQYSHFSVVSWFPYKTVHHLRNFLAVLFPTPANLYKVEIRETILDTCAQHLFVGWGQRMGLCSELRNTPEMQKCPKSFAHDCRLWLGIIFFLATNWEWAISVSMEVWLQAANMNLRGTYIHMKVRFQCRRTSNLDAPSLSSKESYSYQTKLPFETVT